MYFLIFYPNLIQSNHTGSYERRMDRGPPIVGKHGDAFRRSSLCDLPPTALALQGPVEGATGRSHLVRTTSGSNPTSHAILSIWLIVCGFAPP